MATGGTPRKEHYSKAQSREMFRRIQITKKGNAAVELAEILRRRDCPLEHAKLFLRRLGYPVFAESVTKPGSALIVVGRRRLTPAELLEMVERLAKKG